MIKIGMPHKSLRPNSRTSWQAALKYKKSARLEGYYPTLSQVQYKQQMQEAEMLIGTLILHPRDKRHMDLDNALASCKPHIDGMCLALGIDDKKIMWRTELGEPNKDSPGIELKLAIGL